MLLSAWNAPSREALLVASRESSAARSRAVWCVYRTQAFKRQGETVKAFFPMEDRLIALPKDQVLDSKMVSQEHKTWTYGDGAARTYLCSTDPGLLQLDALNAALGSDMLWWATALPEDRLQTLVNSCMIIGLYSLEPENSGQPIKGTITGRSLPLERRWR